MSNIIKFPDVSNQDDLIEVSRRLGAVQNKLEDLKDYLEIFRNQHPIYDVIYNAVVMTYSDTDAIRLHLEGELPLTEEYQRELGLL